MVEGNQRKYILKRKGSETAFPLYCANRPKILIYSKTKKKGEKGRKDSLEQPQYAIYGAREYSGFVCIEKE